MPHFFCPLSPVTAILYFVFTIPLLFKKYIMYVPVPQQHSAFILFGFVSVKMVLSSFSPLGYVFSIQYHVFKIPSMLLHALLVHSFSLQKNSVLCDHTVVEYFIPFTTASCFPLGFFFFSLLSGTML